MYTHIRGTAIDSQSLVRNIAMLLLLINSESLLNGIYTQMMFRSFSPDNNIVGENCEDGTKQ